ncbi:MAG: hypothetical protein Q4D33_01530 [Prevotellaceae bacterium]|nr:hypothetical protein [Prevotellaceae bacterium]
MTQLKKIIATVLFATSTLSAMAGGLLTNTNQNASFLRQMSQNGIIDITGLYANPAGTAFLENGWHLSLNNQSAWQTRNIKTTFPLFAYNVNDHNTMHEFEGKATAPAIPSFQVSYNHDKWSVFGNFALVGGGGKCEFDKGLGSFEALYSGQIYSSVAQNVAMQLASQAALGYATQAIPQLMAAGMTLEQAQAAVAGPAAEYGKQYAQEHLNETMQQAYQGYSLDAYMKGRQYYFGLTLGGTYKITDNLAISAGIRGVYATCNYNGYVQDVKYTVGGQTADANSDLTLNCDQTGFAITPIIGFDCKINDQWNVAVKYEMTTRMSLKNKTEMNDFAKAQAADPTNALAQFKDGEKVREDIPGIIAVGAQYKPIEAVRINASMNYYVDKNAKKYNNKQKMLDDNTLEIIAGAEYDICKYLTVSASWQNTNYGQSDAYMNDLSFNLSSNSIGCGFRINATERCSIDLGYMHTFYQNRTVNTETAAGIKSDLYNRTNNVVGVGVNLNF